MECTWFENWFDSKYYHILYGNRDETEAESFLDNLLQRLKPLPDARIHDLCCGRGRYSILLNKKGFEVAGTDLSAESIQYASLSANPRLSFFVHDMRKNFRHNYFDFVFNLFTSFGYFNSDAEHEEVIHAVHTSLKTGGIFVLDYLNSSKTIHNLKPTEIREAEGIRFQIRKKVEQGYILKDIQFQDKGKDYHFTERVRAFTRTDLETMLSRCGFEIQEVCGNYALHPFEEQQSDRLILIALKK
jgi:SAM-dependent methyltransferase